MLASVSRWRIAESLRDDDDLVQFLQLSLKRHIANMRDLALLDVLVIRVSPDCLLVVTVYEDDAFKHEAWTEFQSELRDDLAGKLELLGRESGPAYDIPKLIDVDMD